MPTQARLMVVKPRPRKRLNRENLARMVREETQRLFEAIGIDEVVHLEFIRTELKLVFRALGLGFDSAYMRSALLTKDSPFALFQNMVWFMEKPPHISYPQKYPKTKRINKYRRR